MAYASLRSMIEAGGELTGGRGAFAEPFVLVIGFEGLEPGVVDWM